MSLDALVVGTELPEYRVSATPTHDAWENKIHEDELAREFGFRGGLVPGVTVYAWMTRPVVAALGGAWLDHGRFSVRFAKPVYFGQPVTVRTSVAAHSKDEVTIQARVVNDEDEVCATATMGTPELLLERPVIDAFLTRVTDTLPVYQGADAPAHPGLYLDQANRALDRNVRVSPWIHVESHGQHLTVPRLGERLATRAKVKNLFQGKGHEFVELDLLLVAEGTRPVASIRHVAIYQLRATG